MGPYMSEFIPVELDMKIMNFLNQKAISPHGSVKLMISVLRLFLLMIRRIVICHLSLSLMMKLDLRNKKFHVIYKH